MPAKSAKKARKEESSTATNDTPQPFNPATPEAPQTGTPKNNDTNFKSLRRQHELAKRLPDVSNSSRFDHVDKSKTDQLLESQEAYSRVSPRYNITLVRQYSSRPNQICRRKPREKQTEAQDEVHEGDGIHLAVSWPAHN